jgi:hypothetical protein
MALRIRFQYPSGSSLGYSIERLADGLYFDFSNSTFSLSPATLIVPLPEDTVNFLGRYKVTLNPTPGSQFTNGNYVVTVHNLAASNVVVAELATVMQNGDDSPVLTVADPWATSLPGSYAAGSAGAILGGNLDAKVSTRSIYAGGPVASVTGGVGSISGVSFPTNFASLSIDPGGNVFLAASQNPVMQAGVAQGSGGGNNTIQLATAASTVYVGSLVRLYANTGTGQTRTVTAWNSSTKVATVDWNWTINPDNTSNYAIIAADAPALNSALAVTAH